jgi:hypothetical protein
VGEGSLSAARTWQPRQVAGVSGRWAAGTQWDDSDHPFAIPQLVDLSNDPLAVVRVDGLPGAGGGQGRIESVARGFAVGSFDSDDETFGGRGFVIDLRGSEPAFRWAAPGLSSPAWNVRSLVTNGRFVAGYYHNLDSVLVHEARTPGAEQIAIPTPPGLGGLDLYGLRRGTLYGVAYNADGTIYQPFVVKVRERQPEMRMLPIAGGVGNYSFGIYRNVLFSMVRDPDSDATRLVAYDVKACPDDVIELGRRMSDPEGLSLPVMAGRYIASGDKLWRISVQR